VKNAIQNPSSANNKQHQKQEGNRSGSIAACSTPHDYKPSSILALSASPNLHSHPSIRLSLHPATRRVLFTQQKKTRTQVLVTLEHCPSFTPTDS